MIYVSKNNSRFFIIKRKYRIDSMIISFYLNNNNCQLSHKDKRLTSLSTKRSQDLHMCDTSRRITTNAINAPPRTKPLAWLLVNTLGTHKQRDS